jgi:60 kDa SS-A/Ro ribonucleoprotein
MLVDGNLIKKSLVLPFRFTTALKELEGIQSEHTRAIVTALNLAVETSLDSVPKLPGRTLIALDGSGSMSGRPIEIASLFAAVLYKTLDSHLVIFDPSAQHVTLDPNTPVMSLRNQLLNCVQGGGTDFNLIFSSTIQKFDRIISLSDMQAWIGWNTPIGAFNDYKARTGADPKIYSFDLQGYGTMQFPHKNVYALARFSDKIFNANDTGQQ